MLQKPDQFIIPVRYTRLLELKTTSLVIRRDEKIRIAGNQPYLYNLTCCNSETADMKWIEHHLPAPDLSLPGLFSCLIRTRLEEKQPGLKSIFNGNQTVSPSGFNEGNHHGILAKLE